MASDTEKKMAAIVARCWIDEEFKAQFIVTPKPVLASAGIKLPAKVKLTVVEDSATHLNVVLAKKPLPKEKRVTSLPTIPTLSQLYSYIYTKSIADPKFKQQFIADPAGVVKSLDYPLPDNFTIAVYEDTPTQRYFALPAILATTVRTHALAHMVALAAPVNVQYIINVGANLDACAMAACSVQVVVSVAVLI